MRFYYSPVDLTGNVNMIDVTGLEQTVRVKINENTDWVKAEVDQVLPFRSYRLRTEDGATYRRNGKHVRFTNEPPVIVTDTFPGVPSRTSSIQEQSEQQAPSTEVSEPTVNNRISEQGSAEQTVQDQVATRSGRVIVKPLRYRDN